MSEMDEMEDDSSPVETKKETFTPADRIAELNEIDKSVASLLQSAGAAIQVLANAAPESTSTSPSSLSAQQDAFAQHTSTYFSALSSIEVRLRRQVYALEEAGLIAPDVDRDTKRGQILGSEERGAVIAGGPLDVSWLNARASNAVEKQREKELWARARGLVEELQHKNGQDKDQSEEDVNEETRNKDEVSSS